MSLSDDVSSNVSEAYERRRYEWPFGVLLAPILLISIPINVNGAQQESAHGLPFKISTREPQAVTPTAKTHMPQIATMMLANMTDRTKGAKNMEAAKTKCDATQAVSRSGLYRPIRVRIGAMLAGGRGVNVRLSSSGGRTIHGPKTEAARETMEKIIKDKLPTRPMSPRVSLDASLDARWYRK